jgi:hypothetical protein
VFDTKKDTYHIQTLKLIVNQLVIKNGSGTADATKIKKPLQNKKAFFCLNAAG